MIWRCLITSLLMLPIFCNAQERQTLKPRAISKLVPERIDRYTLSRDSKSSVMKIGTLRYSLCERIFEHRDQVIKILLFDYVEAPIMLTQSVKKWREMPQLETDSVTFHQTEIEFGDVWESSHPRVQRSQIIMAVNQRFFLTLEAEKMSLNDLRIFSKVIDLSKFPK